MFFQVSLESVKKVIMIYFKKLNKYKTINSYFKQN